MRFIAGDSRRVRCDIYGILNSLVCSQTAPHSPLPQRRSRKHVVLSSKTLLK